jgi:hypothetical protein
MLSVVGNQTNSLNKDSLVPAVGLRAFRSKFFKYYIQTDGELKAEDLSALLLYFALSFVQNKRGLAEIFQTAACANNKFEDLTDSEMLLVGNELLALLGEFLPNNLSDVMVVPSRAAWLRAKQFFIKHSNDIFFADIANLGFAYQIFSASDRKEKALPDLQRANKKISKEELVAFTQLYTPDWVVDFLTVNAILSGTESEKISNRYSRWLVPGQNYTDKKGNLDLKDFYLLDPACGAGQFLFSAFDLLMELYQEKGYEKQTAAKLILSKNIFGADIDEKALWVAGLGLLSKYLVVGESNSLTTGSMPDRLNNLAWIRVTDISEKIDDSNFLGSIDNRLPAEHFLKNQYSVLLTNPPYIGRRCLSREIKSTLKEQYPNSSADLAAAFLERCLAMLKPNGKLGIITQSSIMSIPSYKALREYLLNNFYMQAAIHCGPGVFPLASGEKIDSVLLLISGSDILESKEASAKTYFADLNAEKNKAAKLESVLNSSLIANDYGESNCISANFIDQSGFLSGIPNGLLSQLSSDFYNKINKLPKLGDIANIRQGLATTDNGRFVRYRYDVDEDLIGNIWVPYIKGAGGERYASDNPFVVKWGKNGEEIKEAVASAYPYLKGKTAWVVKNEEFYFRPGLCFSFINKSGLAVRRLPAGAIFDVASSAIFASSEDEDLLLAYLNSRVIGILAKAINQTINIQVGDLKQIPIIPLAGNLKDELSKLGNLAFKIRTELLDCAAFLLKPQSSPQSASDLSTSLETYIKLHSRLAEELCSVQMDIDNKVMDVMENNGLINSIEKEVLSRNLSLSETKIFSEKQCAYKMLNSLVANVISTDKGDRLVLLPSIDNDSLSKLFNLAIDGIDWFENKLEISLEKIFSQARVTDISKLAQEPSRYFNYYLNDNKACMLFSSSAARRFKKDLSREHIFITNELPGNPELLNKISTVWRAVFDKLDNITDWTSKDLESAFRSLEI